MAIDDLRGWLRALSLRAVALFVGFWALLDGDLRGLPAGALVVVVAVGASAAWSPPGSPGVRLRPVALARLVAFFLVGSLRGAWDVAWRALSRRMPIDPVVFTYATDLPPGPQQKLLTSIVAVMPGTLSIDVRGRDVRIHALVDRGDEMHREIGNVERLIALAVQTEGEHA